MPGEFIRTQMLIGESGLKALSEKKVAIFGIGGVGSYVAEGLIRTGIKKFVLIDDDVVSISNLNRQIHSTQSTVNLPKVEVMKKRMLDINPESEVEIKKEFVLSHNIEALITEDLDYIVDALDTVTAKIAIAMTGYEKNIPVISAMGTGNKQNPSDLKVSDIYRTSVCPLCKVMRRELRKRGLPSLKVVYSEEEPIKPEYKIEEEGSHPKRAIPGSIVFVPGTAGLLIASEVVKDLILSEC